MKKIKLFKIIALIIFVLPIAFLLSACGDNDLKTLCVSFPNGECFHDVFGRFQKFMQSIPDDEDNVLIVSHGAFIKASLVKYLTERLSVKNCSCIKFKYDTETKVLSDFMCV